MKLTVENIDKIKVGKWICVNSCVNEISESYLTYLKQQIQTDIWTEYFYYEDRQSAIDKADEQSSVFFPKRFLDLWDGSNESVQVSITIREHDPNAFPITMAAFQGFKAFLYKHAIANTKEEVNIIASNFESFACKLFGDEIKTRISKTVLS